MKLIVGLGNPGSKYINTRHNLGFKVVSELAKRYNVKLRNKLFGKSKEVNITVSRGKVVLIQPLTFMNLSGLCVRGYADKLKAGFGDILVICDDLNLELGRIRIRPNGSAGGHNGLESVINSLGSKDFHRLRIGIDGRKETEDLSEYVLNEFREDEMPLVKEAIAKACDVCEYWIKEGIDKAMNLYNK